MNGHLAQEKLNFLRREISKIESQALSICPQMQPESVTLHRTQNHD